MLKQLPLGTLVAMTRPGFLIVTAVAILLGLAAAFAVGATIDIAQAAMTLLLGLMTHAGANVLNDYYDALSGADDANAGRISPFTGGARFIQDARVSVRDTFRYALLLLGFVIPCGIWLAQASGTGLLLIGAAGLLIGWTYSAPPLQLMARGLGEAAIALAWSLVVIGASYVQLHRFDTLPVLVSLGYGLMVTNILLVNGFPDAASDAAVSKRTLVVRLGPERAAKLYGAIAVAAHGGLVAMAAGHWLPPAVLWGLLALPLSLTAAVLLWRARRTPQHLKPAIVVTITACVAHGLALSVALIMTKHSAAGMI